MTSIRYFINPLGIQVYIAGFAACISITKMKLTSAIPLNFTIFFPFQMSFASDPLKANFELETRKQAFFGCCGKMMLF